MTNDKSILINENITFAYWKSRQWSSKQNFIDVDELNSIALFALTKAAETYDSSKASFATYASKVIDRAFQEEIRKIRRDKAAMNMVSIGESNENIEGKCSHIVDIRNAIDLLPPLDKQILIEYHVESYSKREIAKKHDISVSCINGIIQKASRFVANRIKEGQNYEDQT